MRNLFKKLGGFTIAAMLAVAALSAAVPEARAQSAGVLTVIPARKATFTASVVAFAPAASATDFMSLTAATGSSYKLTQVIEAGCDGVSTAAAAKSLEAVIRSSANSGGTPTTLTAVEQDSIGAAATAVAVSYAANPTLGGSTAPFGVVRAGTLFTAVASTGAYTPGLFFVPSPLQGGQPLSSSTPFTLRAGQVFALNGVGASFAAGTALNCRIVWTEG